MNLEFFIGDSVRFISIRPLIRPLSREREGILLSFLNMCENKRNKRFVKEKCNLGKGEGYVNSSIELIDTAILTIMSIPPCLHLVNPKKSSVTFFL